MQGIAFTMELWVTTGGLKYFRAEIHGDFAAHLQVDINALNFMKKEPSIIFPTPTCDGQGNCASNARKISLDGAPKCCPASPCARCTANPLSLPCSPSRPP